MSEGNAVPELFYSVVKKVVQIYLWVGNAISTGISFLWKSIKFIARWAFRLVIPLVLLWWVIGYFSDKYDFVDSDAPTARGAAALINDPIDNNVTAANITYLEQGWEAQESLWFYHTSQGSNLLPYDFFLHLEQKDNTQLFRDDENMNRFRYLPQSVTNKNPDALPVGMTKDIYQGKPYMGFTCAACHTSQINYEKNGQSHAIRIDGGPAAADMENFMIAMSEALEETRRNPQKLERFKQKLSGQGGGYYRKHPKQIDIDLDRFAVQIRAYTEINNPTWGAESGQASHYGYARLDAFGRIFNRVVEHVVDPQEFRQQLEDSLPSEVVKAAKTEFDEIFGGEDTPQFPTKTHTVTRSLIAIEKAVTSPEQKTAVDSALRELRSKLYNPADAPASYPYLWDVPQHDFVQWTGLVSNGGLGPLGRNAGQVIGVFGTLDWQKKNGFPWLSIAGISKLLSGGGVGSHYIDFKSSIDKRNLRRVEHQLRKLYSPKWPVNEFGKLNENLVKQGAPLFDKYCASCHANIDRTDPERRIIANISKLSVIGTDPVLAKNAVVAKGSPGLMQGGYSTDPLGKIVLEDNSPVPAILRVATKGVIVTADADKTMIRRGSEWVWDTFKSLKNNDVESTRRQGDYDSPTAEAPFAPITGYKARALNGIWATAPYLHNGSIPNLYEILLPKRKHSDPLYNANGQAIEYRSDNFKVGSRTFDKKHVGFEYQIAKYPKDTGFTFNTRLHGNSNAGHNYGTDGSDGLPVLTKAERLALLEYLKSL